MDIASTPAPPHTTPLAVTATLTTTASSVSLLDALPISSTDNVGVTGYRVERCQGAGCSNFAQIAAPTGTTFSDTGLTASTSYSYHIGGAHASNHVTQ